MSDPVEEGLRKTEAELEELARRLSPQPAQTPTETSTLANDAAFLLTDLLGAGLHAFIFAEKRPRAPSRFTNRAAVAPRVPVPLADTPSPAPAAPAAIEVVPRPSPPSQDLSVEHIEDWDRPDRLDLTHPEPHNPRPLRGPVVGRQE